MPRRQRVISPSNLYHVISKGIDGQNIFYDDADRNFFLKQILETSTRYDYKIYAYCLMINHIHLILKAENEVLSKVMKSLMIKYVYYFNSKYKRSGPLFQDRFKSKCIGNQKYFLDVCKYVHRNPEKACICKTSQYKWSSYQEYLGEPKIIDKNVLLHYFDNDIGEFIKFTNNVDNLEDLDNYADFEIIKKLPDEILSEFIMKKFDIHDIQNFAFFFKNKNKEDLRNDLQVIKRITGITKTQVSRVIRVNQKLVSKLWDETSKVK